MCTEWYHVKCTEGYHVKCTEWYHVKCAEWYHVKVSGRLNVVMPSRVSGRVGYLNSEYVNVSRNVFHCVGDSRTTIVSRCKEKDERHMSG
jgi:hypothetical protein